MALGFGDTSDFKAAVSRRENSASQFSSCYWINIVLKTNGKKWQKNIKKTNEITQKDISSSLRDKTKWLGLTETGLGNSEYDKITISSDARECCQI